MPSIVRRARGLVARYRIDRRLPPTVNSLYHRAARARLDHSFDSAMAALRPVLGDGASAQPAARLGQRRVATGGVLSTSIDELALDTAQTVVEILADRGLEPFVVDRDDGRVVVGVLLADRRRALHALSASGGPGWFLSWTDRSTVGLAALGDAHRSRHARRARSWTVFRSYQVGERATGEEAGVVITFWTPGSSGLLEQVGTRAHQRFDARSAHTTESVGGRSFPGRSAFPVGMNLERFDGDIDVVYTWVDGADPDWAAAFRSTAAACGRSIDEAALDPARFRSRGELMYSLRSLWMNCGWVRHVWIVTAGQRPDWLADHPWITVVDHRDILPADGVPTFNSHAIEASIHRIDGLAEHALYFNDDMFVTRPLRPETFFHPNGLPYLFQSGARVPAVEDERTEAVDTAAIRGRELLSRRFGRVMESKPLHSPYPLLRSVMAEVEAEFPDIVAATQRSRFRSPSDLSTAASFSQHYAFATRRAVLGDIATEYVHVESGRLRRHLDAVRLGNDVDTCCINETRHDDRQRARQEADIRAFFEAMFPIPAPWEVQGDR